MENPAPLPPLKPSVGPPEDMAVVVLTHNGLRWVEACLRSVLDAGVEARQIYVVDNASADGTPDLVRRAFPEARLIVNSRNLGFAAGCNVGVRRALRDGAQFIALLNQDACVAPDCFARLREAAAGRGPAALFVPLQLTYDGSGLDPSMRRGILAEAGDFADDLWRGRLRDAYELPLAYGGALLFHRAIFDRVGLFDECFFLYGEDEDLCRRLRRAGFPIWLAPRALVRHWHTLVQGAGERNPQIAPHVRRARHILALKDPDRAWLGRCLSVAATLAARALRALARLDLRDLAAALRDGLWLLARLGRIRASREHDIRLMTNP